MRAGAALNVDDFDTEVRIQDDLFRHVNGHWLANTEIPEDKPVAGGFITLRDEAEEAVRRIITELEPGEPGSEATKIADLYAGFMDETAVEEAGAAPLAPLLAEVNGVSTVAELITLVGSFPRRAIAGLINFEAESDPGDPNRYVMFVSQGGLGLPDEAYYRLETHADLRDQYRDHVAASLRLAEIEEPEKSAQRVLDLETEIAAGHWDRVKCRDMRLSYNLMSLDAFVSGSPGLQWEAFLTGAGVPEQAMAELVVQQPSFFTAVAELITDDRLPAWKIWAQWKLISSLSPYLSSAFVNERFRFYGTILSGTPVLKERWKRGVELVEGALGEAVGKIYVERHFSPVAKERMDQLVANLIEAYRQSINELDWMTDATKQRALDKLRKFRPHIGFPSKWRDYSTLQIDRRDLVGNVMRAASFEVGRSVAKIGQPIDREEWLMTPQTVNAYYHPLRNEIVFPAAILQPPFFSEDADDAINYGGIGAIIGHEIGHGFDDQGSTCDGDGALVDWWTAEDRAAFEKRTRVLIYQYGELEPEQAPGHRVNGELTIGENIGDLGGLSIALKAYRISTGDDRPDPIDGFTDEQRLFLSWAYIWHSKIRTEMLLQRLATDPHSPAEFRCNQTVRNIPDFYATFGVTESDRLWLDEDQRVKIW
ncbi:MAG TPA: M13-type metalloendopeptidase [Propionibacteriaceae bacterium]|nr:M13-type metalloendopeptidase [Propionibacteriaceae bacterium]